jgi:hypothetical protein
MHQKGLFTIVLMWQKHLIVLQTLSSGELTTLPLLSKNMIKNKLKFYP